MQLVPAGSWSPKTQRSAVTPAAFHIGLYPAFAATVEFSIYVSPGQGGRGIGTELYRRLLNELEREPIHRVLVGIALPNEASVALHRRDGFEEVGVFDEYAEKWGTSISSMWMQFRR